jgi:fluoride exporter
VIALLVGLGAAVGAMLRYVVDRLIESQRASVFPFGTVTINLSGSLLLGVLTGLGLHHGLDSDAVAVLGAGVLGGYTTFSAWAWETVVLTGDGDVIEAVANVVVSLAGGILAAAAGLGLARL